MPHPGPPAQDPAAATPPAAAVARLMADAASITGMARALLCTSPLDTCRLHPKLQCWVGAVEACLLYHQQRNAAAAEALVQANPLKYESSTLSSEF